MREIIYMLHVSCTLPALMLVTSTMLLFLDRSLIVSVNLYLGEALVIVVMPLILCLGSLYTASLMREYLRDVVPASCFGHIVWTASLSVIFAYLLMAVALAMMLDRDFVEIIYFFVLAVSEGWIYSYRIFHVSLLLSVVVLTILCLHEFFHARTTVGNRGSI